MIRDVNTNLCLYRRIEGRGELVYYPHSLREKFEYLLAAVHTSGSAVTKNLVPRKNLVLDQIFTVKSWSAPANFGPRDFLCPCARVWPILKPPRSCDDD